MHDRRLSEVCTSSFFFAHSRFCCLEVDHFRGQNYVCGLVSYGHSDVKFNFYMCAVVAFVKQYHAADVVSLLTLPQIANHPPTASSSQTKRLQWFQVPSCTTPRSYTLNLGHLRDDVQASLPEAALAMWNRNSKDTAAYSISKARTFCLLLYVESLQAINCPRLTILLDHLCNVLHIL